MVLETKPIHVYQRLIEDRTNLPGLDGLVSSREFTNLADSTNYIEST